MQYLVRDCVATVSYTHLEGDFSAGKKLVEEYAVKVDPALHAEVLERYAKLVTAYGNNAEFVEKYLEKGIKIALSGELVISQIKDEQTGTASYYTEVIMDDVEFAEAKTKKEESDGFQPAEKRKIPFDIPEELEQEMPFR